MDLHTIAELGTAVVAFAGFVVMLMIRGSQAEVKAQLLQQINVTDTALAVHAARDEEKFKAIDGKLERIEGKLDRINGTTVVVNPKA